MRVQWECNSAGKLSINHSSKNISTFFIRDYGQCELGKTVPFIGRRNKMRQQADHIKKHVWDFSDYTLHTLEKIFSKGATVTHRSESQFSDGSELKEQLKATDLDQHVNSSHL